MPFPVRRCVVMTPRVLVRFAIVGLAVATTGLAIRAQQTPSVGRPLAIEDDHRVQSVGNPAISPDRIWVIFTVSARRQLAFRAATWRLSSASRDAMMSPLPFRSGASTRKLASPAPPVGQPSPPPVLCTTRGRPRVAGCFGQEFQCRGSVLGGAAALGGQVDSPASACASTPRSRCGHLPWTCPTSETTWDMVATLMTESASACSRFGAAVAATTN